MVTFAQAQERAERWVNGEVPAYQQREVRVREFGLGFVAWAEDREGGPAVGGGRQRMVIARDSGETTLWPGLPVGEVIRRYEEEYGVVPEAAPAPEVPRQRIDLEQTSFLLTPPEWLQEAADAAGIPDRASGAQAPDEQPSAVPAAAVPASAAAPEPQPEPEETPEPEPEEKRPEEKKDTGASVSTAAPSWEGTDITVDDDGDDRSVGLPATVFAPPLSFDEDAEQGSVRPDAKTELLQGGSRLPATAVAPAVEEPAAGPPSGAAAPAAAAPGLSDLPPPSGPPVTHLPPPPGAAGTPPAAPGTPAEPGPPPAAPSTPAPSGAPGSGGYVPTQMISQLDSDTAAPSGIPAAAEGAPPPPPGPPAAPGAPGTPGTPGTPAGGVHAAATMLADGSSLPGNAGAAKSGGDGPPPPSPPGVPGAAGPAAPPPPPGPPATPPPGAPGAPGGGVHAAATMLAGPGTPPPAGPGAPPPAAPSAQPPAAPGAQPPPGPGMPPPAAPMGQPGAPGGAPQAYGSPQAPPTGQPTVGPGYMAVLRYRAPDGSEQQIIRRSAPGTPHPEWQILHELRGLNVPPQQVLELHTELESCDLPGGYCARMIRETWPQVRISHTAAYGHDHASRQQGVRHLVEHQGELHQVADGPARPAPVRVPLPHPSQIQLAPPAPPQAIGQELEQAFGPQGVFRFDQRAVSRQGVPDVVGQTLVWAGVPVDFGPFFWGQAQPGRPVPTLAELAQERGVQPAPDAGSYLVMGSDFGRQLCVQYGTAHIVAVPLEAGPGGQAATPQFVNTGLPEFVRCMAMLGRMWRLRYGLNPEQAGRWTTDFQVQLAALDPAALGSPENWWSVLLEQMWDGLL
ncbi:SUKH-4 family immunity protein [Streptomyces sp. NPDC053542]|uniref:SUKH-4 family immunity protein n=1 Tax=Streptomyces sp. NPDC053542 TaxID=3365710 RepID=UPI0037D390EA